MKLRKGQDDLPNKPANQEISPRRGLIFYCAGSALIHGLALLTLLGPSVAERGRTEFSPPSQTLVATLRPALPALVKSDESASSTTAAVAAKRVMPPAKAEEGATKKTTKATAKPLPPDAEPYFLSVDVDEPAKPISFGSLIYPVEQLLNRISGVVTVDVLIDATGHVTAVKVVRSVPPDLFESAAIAAVAETLFRPAYLGGKPVRSVKRIEVNFDPEEEPKP